MSIRWEGLLLGAVIGMLPGLFVIVAGEALIDNEATQGGELASAMFGILLILIGVPVGATFGAKTPRGRSKRGTATIGIALGTLAGALLLVAVSSTFSAGFFVSIAIIAVSAAAGGLLGARYGGGRLPPQAPATG